MAIKPEPQKFYKAPITLGFAPADGDLIGGTINGVEVNGQWIEESKHVILYRVGNTDTYTADGTNVPFCMIGFSNEKAVISFKQDSAPTTDYELHLYRYVPADIVKIPREYVEGLEMLPKDGNPGDVLVKTETGGAWQSFVEDMIEEDMLPAVKIGSDILGINNDILMM